MAVVRASSPPSLAETAPPPPRSGAAPQPPSVPGGFARIPDLRGGEGRSGERPGRGKKGWAIGISFEFSTINPFSSGGGGSYGINIEYTSSSGWGLYYYITPNDQASQGFLVGPSIEVNFAEGSGSWTGPFDVGAGSFDVIGGGYFHSPLTGPDLGYFGWSLGATAGPPGVGFTRTVYSQVLP